MADESRNKRGSEDDMDDIEGDRPSKKQRYDDYESLQADVRFLLPSKNAGAVIGRGGENVKRLRQDVRLFVLSFVTLFLLSWNYILLANYLTSYGVVLSMNSLTS